MTLTDKRAYCFYQVVQQGGIRAAADVLNIAPSAVSRQIASLEKSLGVTLIERHTKGAILTTMGEKVLSHYKQIHEQEEHLKQELNHLQGLKSGRVHISTGVGYLNHVSQMVNEFAKNHPNIVIEIDIYSSTEIIRKVIDGETDIGLLYNSINHPQLKSHFRAVHKLHVFMNPNHALANKSAIELSELTTQKIAFTDHSYGIRQVIAQAETALGIILPISLLCNDMHLLKRYASANGITILPELLLYQSDHDLVSIPLILPASVDNGTHDNTQIITRQGRYTSIATQAMLQQMIKTLKQLG
ncbi:LysR family transcriptional regulator [Moraxella sp. Pampa]|uniref:LysR family transcriptional regulator n=1 Tax=Moraxella sp. Pampa TaxID=3111978 RepID=UPI002B410378|nr:LysR family transcriptional regulator [Moraxella sp. Pampa]